MGKQNPLVTKYIDNSQEFAKPILNYFREAVHKACPEVEEKMKWGTPHFDYKGPFCSMAAFKAHAIFAFGKQSLLKDPNKLFGDSMNAMGSLGRLTNISEVPSEKIMLSYLKEAIKVNDQGLKVKVTKHPKPELIVPDYFKKALVKDKIAEQHFNSMSPSHKREYLEWIMEAKAEETRNRRIEKTLNQLKENKSMHWKYK